MSRGPGRIERELLEIFNKNPTVIRSTSDLCRQVYGIEQVEKKHRVAVLRALKSMAGKSMPWLWRDVARYERSDDFWYDWRIHPARGADRAPAAYGRPKGR